MEVEGPEIADEETQLPEGVLQFQNYDQYGLKSYMDEKVTSINTDTNLQCYAMGKTWQKLLPRIILLMGSTLEYRERTKNLDIQKHFTDINIVEGVKGSAEEDQMRRALGKKWKKIIDTDKWHENFIKKLNEKRAKKEKESRLRDAQRALEVDGVLKEDFQDKRPKPRVQYQSAKELFDDILNNPSNFSKKIVPWVVIEWSLYFETTLRTSSLFNGMDIIKYSESCTKLWGKWIGFNVKNGNLMCFAALNPSRLWFAPITAANTRRLMKYLHFDDKIIDPIVKVLKCCESLVMVKKLFAKQEKDKLKIHDLVFTKIEKFMERLYDQGVFQSTPEDFEKYAMNHEDGIFHTMIKKNVKQQKKKSYDSKFAMVQYVESIKAALEKTSNKFPNGFQEADVGEIGKELCTHFTTIFTQYDGNVSTPNIIEAAATAKSHKYKKNDYWTTPSQLRQHTELLDQKPVHLVKSFEIISASTLDGKMNFIDEGQIFTKDTKNNDVAPYILGKEDHKAQTTPLQKDTIFPARKIG